MKLFWQGRRNSITDPDFGLLVEEKAGSWIGQNFTLWDFSSIQVMVDADSNGPSASQRTFIQSLRSDHLTIRSRVDQAVAKRVREHSGKCGRLKLTSLYLPADPLTQTWRLWFDIEGEEQFWAGAEVQGWDKITPFLED